MKTFSDLKGNLLLTEFRIWCPNHPSLLLRYQNDVLPCYPRIAALSFKGFIYKVSILSVLLDAVLFHQEVSYENWVVHICNGFVFDLSANTQFPCGWADAQIPEWKAEHIWSPHTIHWFTHAAGKADNTHLVLHKAQEHWWNTPATSREMNVVVTLLLFGTGIIWRSLQQASFLGSGFPISHSCHVVMIWFHFEISPG